jgi:hypothetical protein
MKALSTVDIEHDGRKLPRLGKRTDGVAWHPRVKDWWHEVWRSPVVAHFDATDYLTVWELADIKHRRHLATEPQDIVKLSTEERQLMKELGLSPRSRQAMKVEIDKGEQAERRIRKRRNQAAVKAVDANGEELADPRDILSA